MPELVTIWSRYSPPLPADGDILAYPGAKAALARLTSAGVNRKDLFDRLRVIALLERMPILGRGDWAKGSGKTRRTIRYFPGRIRSLAVEIERANAHNALSPALSNDKYQREVFPCLPNVLRSYADWLTARLTAVTELNAKLSRERSLQQKLLLHLAVLVHDSGANYFDEDVSLLVTAAYAADGQDKDVSAQALKVLHSPKRRIITHPRIAKVNLDASAHIIEITLEV